MSFTYPRKRKRSHPHPYLSGNFAPVWHSQPLTPCKYSGTIPEELYGGEYVRNGGNPVSNEDLGRDAHWFDGDGMLSGVAFTRTHDGVQPEFVNQYVLTDVFLSSISSHNLHVPILPSIATLVDPLSSLYRIVLLVFRTIFLVILSRLPGSGRAIKKISVANTGIVFHDGRALATCESGPPMRIALPGLETVGWYNGRKAEGEYGVGDEGPELGGKGLLGFMKEWTTAHPRVDPTTKELILFHSTFIPPYVHYSIIPATHSPAVLPQTPLEQPRRLLNVSVPGIASAKMMHDFGVSLYHTVIMDLPLSLDPLNLIKNLPVVAYDACGRSRFGVFPRYVPQQVRWFETDACCIFHTANTWDEQVINKDTGEVKITAVNMLACRLTSASLVFAAGDIALPQTGGSEEDDQCRLYYYQFCLDDNSIKYQFALSTISFEFPSTRDDRSMSESKYIYGCSSSEGSFGAALGRAVKIDCLVKINAAELIQRGKQDPTIHPVTGCVDQRTIEEVCGPDKNSNDPISIFRMPQGWYAQEPRFVPRRRRSRRRHEATDPEKSHLQQQEQSRGQIDQGAEDKDEDEDDGWLLTYVFDESQLDAHGECRPDATSELWIIDAKDMTTVVGRVQLPRRVSYGLHGGFFSEDQVKSQRPVETIRGIKDRTVSLKQQQQEQHQQHQDLHQCKPRRDGRVRRWDNYNDPGWWPWLAVRDALERLVG
ncbi:Carotenoid dioxygenase carX [Exophiala dermatitidis]